MSTSNFEIDRPENLKFIDKHGNTSDRKAPRVLSEGVMKASLNVVKAQIGAWLDQFEALIYLSMPPSGQKSASPRLLMNLRLVG